MYLCSIQPIADIMEQNLGQRQLMEFILSISWWFCNGTLPTALDHYSGVIMGAIASQITSLTIVHSTVYSDADQRKHQSSASLAFVWGIHRGPVNFPHKWPVTRKMFPFDDVIMYLPDVRQTAVRYMNPRWSSWHIYAWLCQVNYWYFSIPNNDQCFEKKTSLL